MVNKCFYCDKELIGKSSRAKYCDYLCRSRDFRNIKIPNNNRLCKLCLIDINDKKTNAEFCSRSHKEKYYRINNREKYREYKRNEQKRNKDKINEKNRIKRAKEKEEYGYTKNYLQTYAQRHINDLIKLKGKKCHKCGSLRHLEIHHIKYTKDPKDWIFLCRECHMLLHNPKNLLK